MELGNVLIFDANELKGHEDLVCSKIDKERVEKAYRFKFEKDQLLSLGAALLMKFVCGSKAIDYSKDKPFSRDGPRFSVSHSGHYVVIYSSEESEVGVDIQENIIFTKRLIEYIGANDNLSNEELTEYWCLKEAIGKCLGIGLGPLLKATIEKKSGVAHCFGGKIFYSNSFKFDGYTIVAVNETNPTTVEFKAIYLKDILKEL